jgi:hypothetical protein
MAKSTTIRYTVSAAVSNQPHRYYQFMGGVKRYVTKEKLYVNVASFCIHY